jgi:hypothetical protein
LGGKIKSGQDVTRLADEFRLKVPAALKGVKITWAGGGGDEGIKAIVSNDSGRCTKRPRVLMIAASGGYAGRVVTSTK